MRSLRNVLRKPPLRPSAVLTPPAALVAFTTFTVLAALAPLDASAYELVRTVVSGGAVQESGATYSLAATVGEGGPVGVVQGGSWVLAQGFWSPVSFLGATDAEPPIEGSVFFINGLRQNRPDPFSRRTSIAYTVGRPGRVHLAVYDVTGRRVARLVDAVHQPGRYEIGWDGRDGSGRIVATGVYFYRLEVGSWAETRRMLNLR